MFIAIDLFLSWVSHHCHNRIVWSPCHISYIPGSCKCIRQSNVNWDVVTASLLLFFFSLSLSAYSIRYIDICKQSRNKKKSTLKSIFQYKKHVFESCYTKLLCLPNTHHFTSERISLPLPSDMFECLDLLFNWVY